MGRWNQTSNTVVVVNAEKTTRTSVNNLEAHNRQYILKNNARLDYKKYNYRIPTDFDNKKYREVIWGNLRTGTKFDKSTLQEGEFWVGRVYKNGSGKTTTYCESMTFCPPYKIHPDEIEDFLTSPENEYFYDIAKYIKSNERFKDCIILGMNVHMNEIYIPESITLEDGTEQILPEEERWQYAYIKPHLSVDFIPTVKAVDKKTGKEYLKLSRTDVWKSRKGGRYCDSYREFNDDRFEMVDSKYGFDRGDIYAELPEEERPTVQMTLKEWQKVHDQERIDKLIKQQQEINEREIDKLIEEAEKIEQAKKNIDEDVELFLADKTEKTEDYYLKYKSADRNCGILMMLLMMILDLLFPLRTIAPDIFASIDKEIQKAEKQMETNTFIFEDKNI